ncbi:uncharacterized protein APUU_51523S [Aspergillus puulaauensis]|uniref:Major facilitator superfamily (MFS) profile domain-containing protein n=1 Tax=Aspergillus puulaauensis TaxID=1220207 RepID=A0A7R7XS80_9EURO|nr:uncharacterized protein APUU_51523S [Aspergillus puulaauensis]BCS26812.1 hypothetical protein APUU_51523S [Aspergillus puulaauensis]
MLLVGRFLTGLGAGMVNCSIPLYQAEVSPPKQRGRMVGSHGVMLSAGFAFAGWAGYGCYYEPNHDIQWRLLLCLQVVSPAILLAVTPWLPESPRWLVLNDKTDLAFRTLKRLHQTAGDSDDTVAREELIQIFAQIELEKAKSRSLISMLQIPSYRRRLLTGFFIQFLCQSSGVTVINNYSVMLYTMLGIPSDVQLLIYAIWLTWSCISNLIGSLIVDRLGRVLMFKIGFVSSVVALSIYTGLMSVYSSQESKVGSGAALAFAFLFLGCFGIFVDAVSYIYVGEIFPLFMRATGISFSISGWFSAALVYNEVAATAFNQIGWRYNLVFICITVVSLPVIIFLLPETKNLPLEEVSRLFGDEVALGAGHMTAEDKERIVESLVRRGAKGDVVQQLVGTAVEIERL